MKNLALDIGCMLVLCLLMALMAHGSLNTEDKRGRTVMYVWDLSLIAGFMHLLTLGG